MITKIIKELLLILFTSLLAMLLFAMILYEYVPNRKVVAEVTEYTASKKLAEQVADKVNDGKDDVVLTYEVTASDLNNYKITNDYVPGKANPFAEYEATVDGEGNTVSGGKAGNSSTISSSSSGSSKGNASIK